MTSGADNEELFSREDPTLNSTATDNAGYLFPISEPAEQQMDTNILAQAKAAAPRLPNLLAYVVVHNGFLVDEYYAEARTPETKHHIRSITKSIMSALVGIALDKGYIESLDTPILHYFPEYTNSERERKAQITLKHLLTMTAGFDWDELTLDAEKEAIITDWFFGGKRAALYDAIQRPLTHEPGSTFAYDSPAADLLSVILTRATQQDVQTFARTYLFGPLGITDFDWEVDPAGFYRGSAGLVMRARDVAKLGQLYLQQGQWQQQQLLSPTWVAQSIHPHVVLGDGAGYGYLWWISNRDPLHFFSAVGFGGQLLMVAPTRRLVVVAQQHWWKITGETAIKNSTDFYQEIFMRVVESTQDNQA